MQVGSAQLTMIRFWHLTIVEQADAVAVLPNEAVVALDKEACVFVVGFVGHEVDVATDAAGDFFVVCAVFVIV